MSAEEHKKNRWNRRLIPIIGAITFIATIIGMLPTPSTTERLIKQDANNMRELINQFHPLK